MSVEGQQQQRENDDPAQRNAVLRQANATEQSATGAAQEAHASNRVRVMKFGGSVLTSAGSLMDAAAHAVRAAETERVAVVVSALRGITDRLYSVTRALRMRDAATALVEAEEIAQLHLHVGRQLFSDAEQEFQFRLELAELAHALDLVVRHAGHGESPLEMTDEVVSFGERLSARILRRRCASLARMRKRSTRSNSSSPMAIARIRIRGSKSLTRKRERLSIPIS